MSTKRAHVLLPEDLLREIDALVGPRGRSSFLVETARQEVRRQKLLHFLESENSAWKNKDHPELAEGADAWVSKLRTESEARRASLHKPLHKPKTRARTQTTHTH
jgi:metal-responsive CopG/Arc/MetJ family transcriptional regulator